MKNLINFSILCAVFLIGLSTASLQAQKVAYYKFATPTIGTGTYTSLSGATNFTGSVGKTGDQKYKAFPRIDTMVDLNDLRDAEKTIAGLSMGFNFTYGGVECNTFMPVSNGYIMLGKDSIYFTDIETGNTLSNKSIGLSADAGVQFSPQTQISYKVEGAAGSKVLSVEFKKLSYDYTKGEAYGKDSLTYTIRLYEADDHIEFYFGSMYVANSGTWFNVGLRGAAKAAASLDDDCHFRSPETTSWDATVFTSRGGNKANFKTGIMSVGTVYSFSLADPCIAPTSLANISFYNVSSTAFEGTVSLPEGGAGDGFLCVVSTQASLGKTPEKGVSYLEEAAFGNGTVLRFGEIEDPFEFELEKLEPNTRYYISTWVYNVKCADGPIYAPVKVADTLLAPVAPKALELTYLGGDQIKLFPKGNTPTEPMIVLATIVLGEDAAGNEVLVGDFGIPTASSKVGDTVWTQDKTFGGIVIYKGIQPAEAFSYTAPLTNTIYHFGSFAQGADGRYSSLFAQADTLTQAVLPFFETFEHMAVYTPPYGWGGNDAFEVQRQSPIKAMGSLKATIKAGAAGEAARARFSTPEMLFPSGKETRLILNYNLSSYKSRGDASLNRNDWKTADSIIFSVSVEGGPWTLVSVIDKNNAPNFASNKIFVDRHINIKGFEGKRCRVQVEYVANFSYDTYMLIGNVTIKDKPACDAPMEVGVVAQSIFGDKASIEWKSLTGDESRWKLRYKTSQKDWSQGVLVSENPFQISELPVTDNIWVEVKSVCGTGLESEYTAAPSFFSGEQIPFLENFNNLPVYKVSMSNKVGLFPCYEESLAAMSPTDTTQVLVARNNGANLGYLELLDWKTNENYDPKDENRNGCVKLDYSRQNFWFLLPKVEIKEAEDNTLSLDLSIRKRTDVGGGWEYSTPTEFSKDAKLVILVSRDGLNFAKKDTLLNLTGNQILVVKDSLRYKLSLAKYTGIIQVAIYTSGTPQDPADVGNFLCVDNVSIAKECGAVKNLKVDAITETSANLNWAATPGLKTPYFIQIKEGENITWHQSPTASFKLESLSRATRYEVGVAYLCNEDTTDFSFVEFVSAGVECNAPVNLEATDITPSSAELNWEGSSSSYRVFIKTTAAAAFSLYTTTEASFDATGLLANTSYTWKVQGVCGQASSDTSACSQESSFTAKELTCFAPTALQVVPSHATAKATWTGDASQYGIAYRQGDESSTNAWIISNVSAKTVSLSSLKAETNYSIRVRSICAAKDTSAYGEAVVFKTTAIPVCPQVTELKTTEVGKTSAKLSWKGNTENEKYLLRFRSTTATVWDSVNLTETQHSLSNLSPKTVYTWSINAACNEQRWSGWAAQIEFTTESVATEDALKLALNLYVEKNMIHILNQNLYIEQVDLYGTNGACLGSYTVRTSDHVFIPTQLEHMPVLVKIKTAQGTLTYKVLIP